MYALADQGLSRIDVSVWAPDPLSRAGTVAQLRHAPGLRVLQDGQEPEGAVALVVADEIDAETLHVIRGLKRGGAIGIALLATRLDDRGLLSAVEAGVAGILRRNQATMPNIVATIRSVAAGEGTVPPDMLARLMNQVGTLQRQVLAPRGLTFSGLTERELSVLRLLAEGYDTNEVGSQLYYSERTVKNIIHDMTSRLELRNRTHAVAYAIKQGLI
ncbi:MAG TPA: response regulator transcription factor [Candidatus Limnocylindrales bacterium]|jgi:DNA-binding NarL/FixJ family response regulator